jgi:hypothetical protein
MSLNEYLLPLPKPWSNFNFNGVRTYNLNSNIMLFSGAGDFTNKYVTQLSGVSLVLSAQDVINSVVYLPNSAAGSIALQFPSGSAIVNYVLANTNITSLPVGFTFNFKVINQSGGANVINLVAGTGITFVSPNVVPILSTSIFSFVYQGSNNWTVV